MIQRAPGGASAAGLPGLGRFGSECLHVSYQGYLITYVGFAPHLVE